MQALDAMRRRTGEERNKRARDVHAQNAQQHPALNVSFARVNTRFLRRVGKLAQLLAIVSVSWYAVAGRCNEG